MATRKKTTPAKEPVEAAPVEPTAVDDAAADDAVIQTPEEADAAGADAPPVEASLEAPEKGEATIVLKAPWYLDAWTSANGVTLRLNEPYTGPADEIDEILGSAQDVVIFKLKG